MFLAVVITVCFVDQLIKLYIKSSMIQGQSIPVIKNVFYISFVQNEGAAFSLMQNRTCLLITVAAIVVAGVFILYYKYINKKAPYAIALGLIAGGALGNLIDRVRFGQVVDFLDFVIWPVFNFADIAVVTGSCLFALLILRGREGFR